MNTETTPESVTQDMFTVLHGQPAPVVTRWSYSAADPFAVTLGVRGRRNRFVEWLVARDLVIESLTGPAGTPPATRACSRSVFFHAAAASWMICISTSLCSSRPL